MNKLITSTAVPTRELKLEAIANISASGHRTEIDGLNLRVEQLEGELARLKVEKQWCRRSPGGL